jgi:NADH-quinone oxidoreductase subunit J
LSVAAFVFYLLSAVVIASAVAVILSRNPVHSVLWLILAFFNAAGLFVLLGAEFLAAIMVIVYVGAVAVLFLFVVMMLDIDFASLRSGFTRYLPFGLFVAVLLLGEVLLAVGAWQVAGGVELHSVPAATLPGLTNSQSLGSLIYTRYVYVFQAAGMVLLTAMIGAIVLTHRQRAGVRRQNIGAQVARTPASAVDVVRVPVGAAATIPGASVAGPGTRPALGSSRKSEEVGAK